MKRFFGIFALLAFSATCFAQYKPVVVTPYGRAKLGNDALDAKVYVAASGVLLGSTTGTAKHEEISISALPAQTSPGSGTLLLASESGVLKKVDVANLPTGALATDALWDTKGDLSVGTGANTAAKLAVGSNGQFLQAASGETTGLKWAAAGMPAVTEVFTSNGTWTKPTGAVAMEVLCIGGGGGGGAGRRGNAAFSSVSGGGGGGAGGFSRAYFLASQLSGTVSVTRGAGGAGAAATTSDNTSGNNGSGGGTSSFGSYLIAPGGSGGSGGNTSSGNPGSGGGGLVSNGGNGAGGTPTTPSAALDPNYAPTGGGGGSGLSGGIGNYAARAGGLYITFATSGFSNNAGTYPGTSPSAGGSFLYFGQGGGGGSNYQNGAAGGDYGGGGGGGGGANNGTNSGAGGAGANGVVVVITYF